MVETKVPKDIRKFKGKAIGPFSLRQAGWMRQEKKI